MTLSPGCTLESPGSNGNQLMPRSHPRDSVSCSAVGLNLVVTKVPQVIVTCRMVHQIRWSSNSSTQVSIVLGRGVQPFDVSGPYWKKSCLGPHIKYTNTNENKKSHNVLCKFTVLCWAAFIAMLSLLWAAGRGLDTPAPVSDSQASDTSVTWRAG